MWRFQKEHRHNYSAWPLASPCWQQHLQVANFRWCLQSCRWFRPLPDRYLSGRQQLTFQCVALYCGPFAGAILGSTVSATRRSDTLKHIVNSTHSLHFMFLLRLCVLKVHSHFSSLSRWHFLFCRFNRSYFSRTCHFLRNTIRPKRKTSVPILDGTGFFPC